MTETADVVIIGGGIAGLSLAAALTSDQRAHLRVILVEAEHSLAYHTSSRSARQLIPSYGPEVIQQLTARTLHLIREAEDDLPAPVLTPRSFMLIGSEDDVVSRASGSMQRLPWEEAVRLCPQIAPAAQEQGYSSAGLDTTAVGCNTDVLLEHHRSAAESGGISIVTGARVHSVQRLRTAWEVGAGSQAVHAAVVVNAAGAWADELAVLSGVATQGVRPYRRTAAVVAADNIPAPDSPMVAAADDTFYFRRDDDGLLISPAETVPSVPEDAQPRPEDLEALISRLGSLTTLGIGSVRRAWTGLRTQVADGLPVVGFDPEAEGFFWLAGQGGYGFQTSSAIAELSAGLITGTGAGSAAGQSFATSLAAGR
ncbi:FAD-dependent oxidoreductase [Arthrobacter tumbae]|uniref:NAD(P)/FAD-dependent oxidoreductase n=1 Tax=Arthrobacter tumbae TaxID=163874 RepID=UPI001957D131|nr:FAD-dependent oxidoreductase [Arthrobacter tumbae]MBM7782642.1 glycine/D-amino acid oxidase-like deaminating enzyme [Arthrobacter tumbae]